MKRELTLEEIKKKELDILKKFDKICKENNLQYSLAFGTMLGAVRHKGFIPWDDDIDVLMKREDYERLLSLKYKDENYEIKSYRYSKNYYYLYSKMVDTNTELVESWRAEKNMGVYIDIFPLDYFSLPSTEEEFIKESNSVIKKAEKWELTSGILGHKLSHHKAFSIRYMIKLAFKIITLPIRKSILRHADTRNAKYTYANYCASMLQNEKAVQPFIESKYYEKIIDCDFEDFKASIFADYDHILTMIYGDYMTPPPVEQQKSVHYFKAYSKDN